MTKMDIQTMAEGLARRWNSDTADDLLESLRVLPALEAAAIAVAVAIELEKLDEPSVQMWRDILDRVAQEDAREKVKR